MAVLPLALEDLPPGMTGFDTLFSMGVLYHRRAPLGHLRDLRRLLRPGGELVLETLVVEGDAGDVLVPRALCADAQRLVHPDGGDSGGMGRRLRLRRGAGGGCNPGDHGGAASHLSGCASSPWPRP